MGECLLVKKLDSVEDPGCPGGTHPGAFVEPRAIVVNSSGDFYVSNRGNGGAEGRIDIFNPSGIYLTGFKDPRAPSSLALDSNGNLYVMEFVGGTVQLNLYKPTLYNPAGHELKYPETPTTTIINGKEGSFFLGTGTGIAVDPADDHLFVDVEKHISEYSSEAEGNKLLDATIGEGVLDDSRRVAVDGVRRRLYVSDALAPTHSPDVIRVFEADPPYKELETLDGSNVPAGKFQTIAGAQSIAVDEATGDFFVDDIGGSNKEIYQFDKEYKYLFSYIHGFEAFLPEIEVDNSSASPNAGTLFVPSVKEGAHVYAFKPKLVGPPKVEETSVAEVTEDEAEFHARINPEGLETEYRLEYVTQQAFEEGGFSEALVAAKAPFPWPKSASKSPPSRADWSPASPTASAHLPKTKKDPVRVKLPLRPTKPLKRRLPAKTTPCGSDPLRAYPTAAPTSLSLPPAREDGLSVGVASRATCSLLVRPRLRETRSLSSPGGVDPRDRRHRRFRRRALPFHARDERMDHHQRRSQRVRIGGASGRQHFV